MGFVTFDILANEGLSVNGSEGLGGRGEGFEIANQGVTRRNPGEGPKVNGGRTQSQEMDSMDQPQYEGMKMSDPDACQDCQGRGIDWGSECKSCNGTGEAIIPDRESDPSGWYDYMADKFYRETGYMAPGKDRSAAFNSDEEHEQMALAAWKEFMSSQNDVNEEAPFAGNKDPEGWDRQVSTGTNTRDQGVRDDISLKEMFCMQESPVSDMRKAVDKMGRTADRLKKSSEKEKKEHPWASDKVATKIAKDHEKLGEQLKRTIIIKESADVLKPGDWYEAVQFHNLDGVNCNDPRLRGAGYKCRPGEVPGKGYVVYEVQPDGTLETKSANWDSSD
jgi:hypothetical protein